MKNKTCLITGATSGMGLATAWALAEKGARVIIVGRNQQRCQNAKNHIKKETKNNKIDFLVADLSNQLQTREVVREFKKRYNHLDVLVNNAGAFYLDREFSADGLEMTFALNHLGYFLLTNLLLKTLKKGSRARIINVSSAEHLRANLDFDNLQGEKKYNGWRAYCQSKLCNLLFTYELARRLKNTNITVNALHPGWIRTGIGKNNGWLGRLLVPVLQLRAIDAEKGAQSCIYLATCPDLENVSGEYFDKKVITPSSELSYDDKLAKKLWQVSEQLTGWGSKNKE